MRSIKLIMACLFILILSLAGCAAFKGSYGDIVPDDAARKSFESYRMDPGMNYYYSGSDANPNAIIGLKKEYELDNDLWKPIRPDNKLFKEYVWGLQHRANEYHMAQYGFAINDHQGKQIGIWYSVLKLKIRLVKMGTGNKVIVYTPELEVYPLNTIGGGGGSHR